MSLLKKELMDILVCPVDKGALREVEEDQKLLCESCGRYYRVKDGVPIMLPDETDGEKKSDGKGRKT